MKEMAAFQTRPMQHFDGDHQICNMIEMYLRRQENLSVTSSKRTMEIPTLDHFEWAGRDSGKEWIRRVKEDFAAQVGSSPGPCVFELKCFGASMLQQVDDMSAELDRRAGHGDGVGDVCKSLNLLKEEMDLLYKDLLKLLVKRSHLLKKICCNKTNIEFLA